MNREYIEALVGIGKCCGAGLATIGLTGAGVGVGLVFASLVYISGRAPGEAKNVFKIAMLGFALTEAVGLLALMMAFLILYS